MLARLEIGRRRVDNAMRRARRLIGDVETVDLDANGIRIRLRDAEVGFDRRTTGIDRFTAARMNRGQR